MRSQYNRNEVSGVSHQFHALRTIQDFFRMPGDATPGIVIDLPALKMALDERSMMDLAQSIADDDKEDNSHCPVAIVAGQHRSYVACLFAQIHPTDRAIRVFGTNDEARCWLGAYAGSAGDRQPVTMTNSRATITASR